MLGPTLAPHAISLVAPATRLTPAVLPRAAQPVLCEPLSEDVQQRIAAMQAKNQRNGAYVLAGVVAICVWLFTVPPDIRRSNICSADGQSGCVELPVLARRVARHYETCGRTASAPACIAFDFSIDPRSRAAFDATVEAVLRSGEPRE